MTHDTEKDSQQLATYCLDQPTPERCSEAEVLGPTLYAEQQGRWQY